MAVDFNYFLTIKKIVVLVKQDFFIFDSLELMDVYNHSPIHPLLCPKVSAKKNNKK